MSLTMYQIDAFTDKLFSGNPAAVVVLDQFLPDKLMQSVAAENNLSETAFVVRDGERFNLRWFTPTHEVPFCGHATLATAHALIAEYGLTGPLIFNTRDVGELRVTQLDPGRYELDIPRLDPQVAPLDLHAVLNTTVEVEFRNFENVFAVLRTASEVKNFSPDLPRIARLDAGGVVITARGDVNDDADFVSRYFAPRAGIDEDPVTGSTHATLVPYWAGVLGKKEMRAFQCSKRGGHLQCWLDRSRVRLAGQCATFFKASLKLT